MLSGLTLAAMLTAFVAGITGAWSPCGFSMVDTIGTALGNPRRSATLTACATFTIGAVLGGALTFGGLAAVGNLLGHAAGGAREASGAAVALAAALADWRGLKIAPQIRRQVPERWRWTMPLPLACALYGVLLGLGFTTFVLAFAVWALAGISFATGSPLLGLLIGCAFGVGRAAPIVWMAPGVRRGSGAQQLEDMALEPRLWLGLRRLDALGLCVCALFLSGAVATAAGLPTVTDPRAVTAAGLPAVIDPRAATTRLRAGTDPSTAGGELAWQMVNGSGMLHLQSGQASVLPGNFPALSRSSIAWYASGRLTIAELDSMAVKATFPVAQVSALAVSDDWVVYRAPVTASVEGLFAISLLAPAPAPKLILSRPIGVIGRPALQSSTVVLALDTPHGAAIQTIDLTDNARRVLRFARAGATLTNPSLLNGRLLYERIDRCSQQLRIGSLAARRHDRVLLRLASTVARDTGYEPSYEHAYNMGSVCSNRKSGRGGTIRLGATALAPSSAYVTEIPSNAADDARIVRVSRRSPRHDIPSLADRHRHDIPPLA